MKLITLLIKVVLADFEWDPTYVHTSYDQDYAGKTWRVFDAHWLEGNNYGAATGVTEA